MRVLQGGRITIPKKIRESKGWKAGTVLTVELVEGGVLLRPRKEWTLDEIFGDLLDEKKMAAWDAAIEEHRRLKRLQRQQRRASGRDPIGQA